MIRGYEEIANIIDPENGASNYLAAQKAKEIIRAGYRKDFEVPKVYKIEKMIARLKREKKFGVTTLARSIYEELSNERVHQKTGTQK